MISFITYTWDFKVHWISPWDSKCYTRAMSIIITWELVRKENSESENYGIKPKMRECILVKVWETLACLQSAFAPIVNLEVKILWRCYLIGIPELYLLWMWLLCSDFSLFLIPLAFQLTENPQISSPSEWLFSCFLTWLWTNSFSYVFSLISVEIIL